MMGGTPSPVFDEPDQLIPDDVTSYTVSLLGAQGVGKSALISQFMTSECINAYERPKGKSHLFYHRIYFFKYIFMTNSAKYC